MSYDKALEQDPSTGRLQLIVRAEFEAQWSGRLVVMTRRASIAELARRFDITWFLQAMHKYRALLTEVLVASFFQQVLALISPLFFQVVIDKVLVHRGLTTLDVLVIGLVAVLVFETLLTGLRTYVFAHTHCSISRFGSSTSPRENAATASPWWPASASAVPR